MVLIPLAALGVLGLATVVFVHELAEVLVIANAIRAAKATPLPGVSLARPVRATPAPVPVETTASGATGQSDDGCCDGCATDTAAEAATAAPSAADRPLLAITPRSQTETGAPADAAKDPGAVTGCCDSCSTTQPARLKPGTLLDAAAVPVQIRPQKTLPLVDNPRHDDGDRCCDGH